MQYQFPHTIQHKHGEKITFLRMEGERVFGENFVQPNAGPPMHVHYFQDECFTVVKGRIGYQIGGQNPKYAGPGETLLFKRGVPHRFWNAGDDVLHCEGWVDPADNFIFFITNIFDAIDRGKGNLPELFDGAYLNWRYRREFDMSEIPGFVKKVIMPITYFIGLLLGKYEKFKTAPQPL